MANFPGIHSALRLTTEGTSVFLQPIQNGRNIGTCMSVDLRTGLIDTGRVAPGVSTNRTIFGLVGLARLQKGCALVAITGAEQVCDCAVLVAALDSIVCSMNFGSCIQVAVLRGAPVFKLTSTLVLDGPQAALTPADKR